MAKIQFIKKQIELIQQIRHVTRTMKTISAVRWRMGRRTLEESRLFAEQILRLNEIVHLYHPSPLPRPHPSRSSDSSLPGYPGFCLFPAAIPSGGIFFSTLYHL
ncbi:MAG: hypothetical protein NTX88_03885 [Candidatus Atribacteria bacterium]|nr:hypothetical protein [Candidatus Atribacteria bacterium]